MIRQDIHGGKKAVSAVKNVGKKIVNTAKKVVNTVVKAAKTVIKTVKMQSLIQIREAMVHCQVIHRRKIQ